MTKIYPFILLPAVFAGNQLAVQSEFVFDRAPFASCHASTIVELEHGDFLAAWFGGSGEGNPDVAIWGARKSNGKWSEPFELAREPQIATYNPVLFYSKDKTLWLYYRFGPSPSSWTGARRWTRDEGKNWSPIEHLPAGLYGPIKDKPLVLADGTIVSGVSVESYLSWACWVERSTDHGKTWTKHGPIVAPQGHSERVQTPATGLPPVPGAAMWKEIYGIIQPTIVQLADGRLRMFTRSTQQISRICYADSKNGGVTWTDARPTVLPNPNSGVDSVHLEDGRIVIVYNHTTSGRTPLNLAISSDGGDTWKPLLTLESEPGEYSYPAVIQSASGDVHVVYTWNRKRIKHVVLSKDSLKQG